MLLAAVVSSGTRATVRYRRPLRRMHSPPAATQGRAFSDAPSLEFALRGELLSAFLGLSLIAAGALLSSPAPLHGDFTSHVLPGMLLQGIGAGITYSPLFLSALRGFSSEDYGLGSSFMSSSITVGMSLGLATIAACASARTHVILATGAPVVRALSSGYGLGFLLGRLLCWPRCSCS